MTLAETLKPVIKLVLRATYAAYCVVGVACIGLGTYYWGSIEGAYVPVSGVTVMVGVLMLIVGALALAATAEDSKRMMAGVLLLNVVIFVLALGACMTAAFLAYEVEDPVEAAVRKVYGRTGMRMDAWAAVVKSIPHGGPIPCDQLRVSIDAAATLDPDGTVGQYSGFAAGGADADQGVRFATGFARACRSSLICSRLLVARQELAGNCSHVHIAMDIPPLHAFKDECEACWSGFEEYIVGHITGQLWPATTVTGCLFVFVVLLILTVRS